MLRAMKYTRKEVQYAPEPCCVNIFSYTLQWHYPCRLDANYAIKNVIKLQADVSFGKRCSNVCSDDAKGLVGPLETSICAQNYSDVAGSQDSRMVHSCIWVVHLVVVVWWHWAIIWSMRKGHWPGTSVRSVETLLCSVTLDKSGPQRLEKLVKLQGKMWKRDGALKRSYWSFSDQL